MLLILAALIAGSADTAAAKDIRYPETGPVAFLIHLPDSWSAKIVRGGGMVLIGFGGFAGVELIVAPEDARSLTKTPDDLASTMLAAAKAEPFNKHEKGAITGVPADSYYSQRVSRTNEPQLLKVNIIKSVHGYIVLEMIQTDATLDNSQQAELATALKGIRLTGAGSTPDPAKGPASPARSAVTSIPASTEASSNTAQTRAPSNAARIEVPLKSDGGTFVVPVFINGAITLNFVVDSGAADVAVPADVVGTLIRAGTIEKSDITGKQKYMLADGSISPTVTFVIRSLKVGDVLIENVKGSVSPAAGSLLLGQSFLQRFKSWSMDNNKHVLVLEQ
jgi:clan AA aspartic protease (TIGR02281 family)